MNPKESVRLLHPLAPSPLTSFTFVTLVGYVMIAAFVMLVSRVGADPGLGWHLLTGKIILATGEIPHTDPFLWNFDQQRWVSNQWLADVLLYCIYSAYSWLGVHIFCFLIGFSAFFFVLGSSALDHTKSILAQNIAFALAILCGSVHWISRPVVVSLLGFAILDALIRKHRRRGISDRRFFIWLVPLFALWSNLHPAFVLGLVLLGLYAAADLWDSNWSFRKSAPLWSGLSIAVLSSGINPYGFGLHLAALELGRSDFFMNLNTEWRAPTPVGPLFTGFYAAIVIGLFAGLRASGSSFDTLKAIVFAVLALRGARFIPFFGIAAFPALVAAVHVLITSTNLERFLSVHRDQRRGYLRAVVPGLVLLVAILLYRPHNDKDIGIEHHFPMDAIRAAFNDVEGANALPVFHTPDWGGPIIWATFPKRLAWIDDRNELNGEQKYKDFLAIESLGEGWKEKLTQLNFGRVLTRPTAPLSQYLLQSSDWRKIFEDERAVVFERVVRGEG